MLPKVDFSFFSAEGRDVDEMRERLRRWSKHFPAHYYIMTMAERGSIAYKDGAEYRATAIPVEHVVDTAGCGDSYRTGFLCSFAKDGDIDVAMEEGHRMAAKCLSHYGVIEHEAFML